MTSPSIVNRTDDPGAGQDFAVQLKSSGARTQGMHLDPEVQGDILTSGATGNTAEEQNAVAASATRVFRAEVVLQAAGASGDRWLLVVNKASAAINTDLPIARSPKITGDYASIDFGVYGLYCDTGVQLVLSSTPNEVTLPGVAEGFFQWAVH